MKMRKHKQSQLLTTQSFLSNIKKSTALSLILCLALFTQGGQQRGALNANDEQSVLGTGRKQISDINMLLPITSCEGCRKVSYQISAINGCYSWEVSHPNLIELEKIQSETHPDCTNVAMVKAVSTKPSKSLIWISAKDKYSGQVLRCEVKLGLIQRLEIQTHLRQFYLNDYEHLHVAAYDEEGNIFSGLSGFRFDWNIESGNENVKIVSGKEAARTHSELSKDFEFNKLQSEVLFLKGIKQGRSTVTAKITEPGYESVPSTTVQLTITEPFVVIPQQTVHLLPTSKYQFQLAKVTLSNNNMTFTPIQIPNRQYRWNTDDDEIGDIGEDGVFISKDKEGYSHIIVVDQNIANNTAESSIKVVFPNFLDVEISDVTKQLVDDKVLLIDSPIKSFQDQLSLSSWDNNWILVEDHYYLLKVYLYDKDKNLIHMTDNLVINNLLDTQYLEVVKTNKIKSEVVIRAKKATQRSEKITYTSVLESIKSESPKFTYQVDKNRMRAEKEIIVTKAVRINHPSDLVLLPILRSVQDENKFGELWHLQATGGSGYYHWSVLDDKVAQISGSGVVRSVESGITTVIAKDSLNERNYHTIRVEVTPLISLQWLEDHIEIKKNVEETTLNLIAFDKLGRKFTNCTSIEVSYDLKGAGILTPINTPRRYREITMFNLQNKDLIHLKQRFDENPSANFVSDLKQKEISSEKELWILHNNFGICSQQKYAAVGEGLARVKGHFVNSLGVGQTQIIETSYAEIASYDSLITKSPNYYDFFNDLQTRASPSQDQASYQKYIKNNTFVLAFGSSLYWSVSGGTNFWKDIPEKYQSKVNAQLSNPDKKDLDSSLLKSKLISEQATTFEYELSCARPTSKNQFQKSHDFSVQIQQQNQVSRYLLRPAHHQVALKIQCEAPKSLELFWTQENKTMSQFQLANLPSFRVFNQEKHNYVLVNTQHYVRYLIFNKEQTVFFNHSSIKTEIESMNDRMVKVSPLGNDLRASVFEGLYDLRKISVGNQTGTVYINAQAKGYYSKFFDLINGYQWTSSSSDVDPLNLPYEVRDRMRLEIVKNVDVQPKYKSIYLQKDNKFTFKIIHGSGHFSVSINNTDIADKHYIDGERIVTIIPKRDGPIEIRVEDVELPDSIVSVSELLISDINRIEIDAPGTLIEQGSMMEMFVTAFDSNNNPFDDDQYKLMTFNIEIEISQLREKGLSTDIDPLNNRRFVAKGNEPGNYQVNAISLKYSPRPDAEKIRVTSEVLKVEVFPLLEIQPSKLLLTPYMRYTLQIVGGPSKSVSTISTSTGSVEIRFDVENKRIASVDVFREITANEVGDTNLYYEIIQIRQGKGEAIRRSIISKKTVPIRVRLPTSIDIPYNDQRTVYSGSMIKMFAILKFNEEVFTHGIAPISYNWNSSNHNVVGLNFPNTPSTQDSGSTAIATQGSSLSVFLNKKIRDNEANNNNAVFLSSFNSSTIYTTGGKQQGEALITVQLAIEYPEAYRSVKNWFTKSVVVRVKDKLKIDIPEFINNPEKQTHLYLMPPNTYSKIETNRRTRLRLGYSQQSVYDYSTNSYQYQEVKTPIISLVNDEGIRTFDKYGKVTVIIEENQAFSDQVVMLNVLITDVYNLAAKDVYQTLSFPLGSQMNIPVKFQNEHGHQFANNIEGIEVGIELSHPRVVSVELDEYNQTLQMKAEGTGECNVIVYLVKQPQIYDVFRVRVQSIVKPFSPVNVHVGAAIKFKIMDNQASDLGAQQKQLEYIWGSSNPSVLDINQKSGEARALHEGKADILLSNSINAASIVYVSKVKMGEVDQRSRKNLVINTDDDQGEVRIRIKLYLNDQIQELTPTVQYDGVTLINQNVALQCTSDNPLLSARGEVNEIEGFFCIISYRGRSNSPVPKSSTVQVSVYSPNPSKPSDIQSALYVEKLLAFDVTYLSQIKVESQFRRGVKLYGNHRQQKIRIISNTQFNVQIENLNEEDSDYEMIKYRIDKTADSEYTLTVTVPQEISHNFQSDIILVHPTTIAKTRIPITFTDGHKRQQARKEQYGEKQQETPLRMPSHREDIAYHPDLEGSNTLKSLIIWIAIIVIIGCFILVQVFQIDPVDFVTDIFKLRNPFAPKPAQALKKNFPLQQQQTGVVRQSVLGTNTLLYPRSQQSFIEQSPGAVTRAAARATNLINMNTSLDSGQKPINPSIFGGSYRH